MKENTEDLKGKKQQKIVNRIPIPGKRSQEYGQWSDGSITRICYAPHNPHYYLDSDGTPHPIDPDFSQAAKTSKGHEMTLANRNVVSMGRLSGTSKEKYLGLRPDVKQDGSEQLEFDLVSVEFDGQEVAMEPTDLKLINSRQRCRQLIPVTRPISSFRIEFRLHVAGLIVKENEDNEYWFYSEETDEFRFRIRPPVLMDSKEAILDLGTGDDHSHILTHSLKSNKDGTYTYIKKSIAAFSSTKLPETFWIDADTYYANTADGYVYATAYNQNNTTSWNSVHDASSGSWGSTSGSTLKASVSSERVYYGGTWQYQNTIYRAFMYMDTSSVSSPDTVSLNIYVTSSNSGTWSAQDGTDAGTGIYVGDYSRFSGSAYGNDATGSSTGWRSISFNATGVSAINTSGNSFFCIRNYQKDYLDSSPYNAEYEVEFYSADQTGTANDPYLSITESVTHPTVTTSSCTGIESNQITGNGNITDIGFTDMALYSSEVSNTGNPAIAQQVLGSPIFCPGLTKANGILIIDLKCDAPGLIGASSLEITSSGEPDTEEWSIAPLPSGISDSYQTFELDLSGFSTTNGELDPTQIDFIRAYAYSTGANITLYWRNAKIRQKVVTRRGFCYVAGFSGDPTTADSTAYDEGYFDTGAFSKAITGLSTATDYRVRAYAINSAGTAYGSTVDVTTAASAHQGGMFFAKLF